MRLNFNPTIPVNNLINSYQINRSAANQAGGSNGVKAEEERRDSFTLSPAGGTRNRISNLMKQKIDIADRKNALISSMKEKGSSMDSIKTQLEAYDEQLRNIDLQISQAIADEAKNAEEKQEQKNEEPKTSEELQYERMTDIVTLSNDAGNVSLLDSVKSKVDGRIKVLESEIELDSSRTLDSGLGGVSSYKLNELADLKEKSAKLTSDIGSRMVDIAEKIDDNNEKVPEKDSELNSSNDSEKNSDSDVSNDSDSLNSLDDNTAK